MLSTW